MRSIAVFSAALLLSACGTMEIGERNFIRPDKAGAPAAPRLDFATLMPALSASTETIATPDGAVLRGVRLSRPGNAPVVLYFGGNMFHLDQHGKEVLPLLAACGADVAVFDYRGYGRSSGAPTLANMAADALRVFDYVNAQYPGRVIVHGQSLGSFMAAHVVQHRPAVQAVVLEATSSTVQEWVDANLPWYARLVTRVEVEPALRAVDNVAAVSHYQGPSLVLVGEDDKLTPPQLARKVFDAMPGQPKKWFIAPGAGHNAIFGHKDVMPVYCGFVNARS